MNRDPHASPAGPTFTEREFHEAMAKGPCLCADIDPSDRPCLTCEGHAALRQLDSTALWSLDVDGYGYPAGPFRPRHRGCICKPPCLGFRCMSPYHVGARRSPWCRGCADTFPDSCDDCWAIETGNVDLVGLSSKRS